MTRLCDEPSPWCGWRVRVSFLPPPPHPLAFETFLCRQDLSRDVFIALESVYLSQISKGNLVKELLLTILALKTACVFTQKQRVTSSTEPVSSVSK